MLIVEAAAGTVASRARKGEKTRAMIVQAALEMASREGLEGLTIGTLADQMQMSKSGVFAHFGSREELQLAVLKEYVSRFIDQVLRPAVAEARGLPRLEAILDRWVVFLAREMTRGCIMIAGAVEYDDRPGPLRAEMVAIITGWKRELVKAIRQAVAERHLPFARRCAAAGLRNLRPDAGNASGRPFAALGRQRETRASRTTPLDRQRSLGAAFLDTHA